MADEYNGWANRETWAFTLWISNEQATDEAVRLVARDAFEGGRAEGGWGRIAAADAIRDWWTEMLDAARENGYADTLDAMRDEVGSLWRVDWLEIADAFLGEDR